MSRIIPQRLVAALAFSLALLFGAQVVHAAAPPATRAVELTFLKANLGQREQLKTFIQLNWFAMDKRAKEQGLMHSYTLLDTGTDEGPWNLIVSVTYMDEKGYEGIDEAFEKIRGAHTLVRVNGKSLRELGAIVDSKRLYETPVEVSR